MDVAAALRSATQAGTSAVMDTTRAGCRRISFLLIRESSLACVCTHEEKRTSRCRSVPSQVRDHPTTPTMPGQHRKRRGAPEGPRWDPAARPTSSIGTIRVAFDQYVPDIPGASIQTAAKRTGSD